ncbi:MAG TPA: hypothetical protein VN747_04040, partial [Burkholderiales bacterium]|nr:hypothetical protein [Burkholderiales bacterium]
MQTSQGGLAHGLSRIPLAAIVLAAGVALSALAWHLVDQQAEREARGRFQALVTEARAQLQARVQSYYGVLNGLRGLFQ